MKFELKINATEANGFPDDSADVAAEVARLLRAAADKLESGVKDFTIYNENGFPVGSAELSNDAKPALKPRR